MRKNESELIFCLPVKTSSYFKLKDDRDKENQKKNKLFSGFDSNVHSNQHLGSDVEIRLQVNDHIWILNKDLVYFGSIFTHLLYLKIQSAVFKPVTLNLCLRFTIMESHLTQFCFDADTSVRVFEGTTSNAKALLHDLIGKSKQIKSEISKRTVDQCKSAQSSGIISRYLQDLY